MAFRRNAPHFKLFVVTFAAIFLSLNLNLSQAFAYGDSYSSRDTYGDSYYQLYNNYKYQYNLQDHNRQTQSNTFTQAYKPTVPEIVPQTLLPAIQENIKPIIQTQSFTLPEIKPIDTPVSVNIQSPIASAGGLEKPALPDYLQSYVPDKLDSNDLYYLSKNGDIGQLVPQFYVDKATYNDVTIPPVERQQAIDYLTRLVQIQMPTYFTDTDNGKALAVKLGITPETADQQEYKQFVQASVAGPVQGAMVQDLSQVQAVTPQSVAKTNTAVIPAGPQQESFQIQPASVRILNSSLDALAKGGQTGSGWISYSFGFYGDQLGKWTESHVKNQQAQTSIGFGYGLIEGLANGLGGDMLCGSLQLPKLAKELATKPGETVKALCQALGVSFDELKAQIDKLVSGGMSCYEGGRLIGKSIGRALGWEAGAKLITKGLTTITKTRPAAVVSEKIAVAEKTAAKETVATVKPSGPPKSNIKPYQQGTYVAGGRKLDMTVKELAAKNGGVLGVKDLAKVKRWEAKITGSAELKYQYSPQAQKILFDSYVQAAGNGGKAVFNLEKLDPQARNMLNEYLAGNPAVGAKARELAPKLAKMNEGGCLSFMDKQHADGFCSCSTKPIKSQLGMQNMVKYEYPDGTLVRYKPFGDNFGVPRAKYSVEVKINPDLPDKDMSGIAFKVDSSGNALPKEPQVDLNNPFFSESPYHEKYANAIMKQVHRVFNE